MRLGLAHTLALAKLRGPASVQTHLSCFSAPFDLPGKSQPRSQMQGNGTRYSLLSALGVAQIATCRATVLFISFISLRSSDVTYPFCVEFPIERAYALEIFLDLVPWEVIVGWVCVLDTIAFLR